MRAVLVIALATLRGFARDRVFYTTLVFAVLFTGFAFLLSRLTIVEQRKILVDFGLSAISLSGVIISVFIGISAIGKEIESKTIYAILSKPIARWEYLLGKYFGCAMVSLSAQAIISLSLFFVLFLLGEGYPDGLLACLYLLALEGLLLLAAATFFSVSLSSSFLAASLTAAIFLIGRSATTFKFVSARVDDPYVRSIMRAFYDVFPNLERFNIRELVAYSKPYPEDMLIWSSCYFLLYTTFFLVCAAIKLRKKDLM